MLIILRFIINLTCLFYFSLEPWHWAIHNLTKHWILHFFKCNFNMISFFKIYVSIYHLIDLLTLYLNKLMFFYIELNTWCYHGCASCDLYIYILIWFLKASATKTIDSSHHDSGLIDIYLFFHKKPCAISKNYTHLYHFFTKPRISNQSLVFE